MKVGLVLEGGAMRGMYTAGVLDIFLIVVLTRPIEYRKKKSNTIMAKMKYSKYPNLVKVISNRYKVYNKTVEKIIDLENKKEIFVIRPSKIIKIGRIERNAEKLQEMYDLGIRDCKDKLKALKVFLEK